MLHCKGVKIDRGADGYDYECEYEHGEISCEDCIMTGGTTSPQTGKLFRGNLKKYQDLAFKQYEKMDISKFNEDGFLANNLGMMLE